MGQRLLARLSRQQQLGLGPIRGRGRRRRVGLGPRVLVLRLGLLQLREPLLRRAGRGPTDRDRTDRLRRRAPDGQRSRPGYDYSQPIDAQAAPPPAEVADPALAKFDSAREAFRNGDYAGALRLVDEALKSLPNDATLHEFRALVLFAVGKYDLAAGPLYAVLSVGPGWDWTTMAGLYPSIEVYTAQLRSLEAFVKANPSSTAGRFVLGYHYLTQGHIDAAVAQFKQVAALAPQDKLSAQLARQFAKPGAEPDTPPAAPAPTADAPTTKPGNLPGNWTAPRPTTRSSA